VGGPEQVEEERRLLYVAMTRARHQLHLVQPTRFFRSHQHRHGDAYVMAMRSRFIADSMLPLFDRIVPGRNGQGAAPSSPSAVRVNVGARMREMWK
jgi:DNA helicase II / ATP-dependent DNA helicase PcrA